MKKEIIILAIVILTTLAFAYYQNQPNNIKKVCIEEKVCFDVEIVKSQSEREKGLGGRDFLDENKGMLFVFEEEKIPGFWMKEMNFSIDILWIKENLEISGIESSLNPCVENSCGVFYPYEKIKYVLEINSGLSEKFGFEAGDKVHLKRRFLKEKLLFLRGW